MDGPELYIKHAWHGRCADTTSLVLHRDDSSLVPEGIESLKVSNRVLGSRCYVSYRIGPNCRYLNENIHAGDMLELKFKIRVADARNAEVHVFTLHNSRKKRTFRPPGDNSNWVTKFNTGAANEWNEVSVNHLVGPDWMYNGQLYPPDKCHFYQLVFTVRGYHDFYLDDVVLKKTLSMPSADEEEEEEEEGGGGGLNPLKNPNFNLGMSYYFVRSRAGYIEHDARFGNAVVLEPKKMLQQMIHSHVVPGARYQVSFWAQLKGMSHLDLTVSVRLRFINNVNRRQGPCNHRICNFFQFPMENERIQGNGQYTKFVTDPFTIWEGYDEWLGKLSFISFSINGPPSNASSEAKLRLAHFEGVDTSSSTQL